MALNFPTDTTLPYIDPASGLKYLYNGEVGGWETAIQPPVVISPVPPAIKIPGFLWWDTIGGSMYVLYKDNDSTQWVETSPSATAISTSSGPISPFNAAEGDFWYNTVSRRLHIYTEGNWQDMIQEVLDHYQVTQRERNVSFSHFKPFDASRGDIWYDRNSSQAYIYSDIPEFTGWKQVGGVRDAVQQAVTTEAVEVPSATNEVEGTVRFATQAEVNSGTGTKTVISPGALKAAIENYVSQIETANSAEVSAGVVDNKAVTPASLQAALKTVPVGTVINHVSSAPRTGYLLCDGQEVSRVTYSDLYSECGNHFGAGDGLSTFNLPNNPSLPFYSFIKY